MKQSKALGIAVFISMMMTGVLAQAAENQVSTVDTGTLFQSHLVQDGKGQNTEKAAAAVDKAVANLPELNIFPGFTDVHVHLREPGFSYKETIESGSAAAAAGTSE